MNGLAYTRDEDDIVNWQSAAFLFRKRLGSLAKGRVRWQQPLLDTISTSVDNLVHGGCDVGKTVDGQSANGSKTPFSGQVQNGCPIFDTLNIRLIKIYWIED